MAYFIYANNEPKSALARDSGDCRDNKGKLAKRVFTCLIALNVVYMENDRKKGLSSIKDSDLLGKKFLCDKNQLFLTGSSHLPDLWNDVRG